MIDFPDSPIERDALLESARTRQGANARASWRVSTDRIHHHLRHCSPDKKELLVWAFLWCIQRGIFLDDFAGQVGFEAIFIDRIITGKYCDLKSGELYDIPDQLAEGIRRFRMLQSSVTQSGGIHFVVTPTVNRIWTGCDLARESQTPVFISGASHIGKTMALERYASDSDRGITHFVRIPSSSGLGGMVRIIAESVGISPNGSVVDLIERIKRAVMKNHVLILDEIHQLIYTYRKESFFACLEVIRSIYDYAKCGMVICTTNVFQKEMEKERKSALEQIFRRGVHRVQLGNIVQANDARLIFEHHGLQWPAKSLKVTFEIPGRPLIEEKPFEILRTLANEDGLKAMTERIRYARKFAAKANEPLDWKHFTEAHLTIAANAVAPPDDWN